MTQPHMSVGHLSCKVSQALVPPVLSMPWLSAMPTFHAAFCSEHLFMDKFENEGEC